MSKLTESQRIDLLRFELESIEAGGPEMVDTDTYEVTGDADASWELSLSAKCGEALAEIRRLERERDALAAHVERMSDIIRRVHRRGVDVPQWLNAHLVAWQQDKPATSLTRRDARMKAEALEDAAPEFMEDHKEYGDLPADAAGSWMEGRAEECRQGKRGESDGY